MDITSLAPFTQIACPTCGEKTRVKRDFGPYLLDRRLSKGGMSVLFVARDTLLDREVAVKILNEEYSKDETRIAAFEEEARVTASLSHPNIVRVLTTGRAFERFFIAMELVPGGHFEHHIRTEGRIPEARMIRLAIQIASGLKAAHMANLIHRDIKPGNILLDAEGNAKIVDFGLALVTHGGIARAKEFWATPYYVPPETIDGQPEDFRSDIYAFGATLYHALAGNPPCNEESMAANVLRAAKKQVVPLHIACPDLSMAVCDIVDKAMAYLPTDRYSSYEALIKDLENAANHNKHGLRGETAGEATRRRLRARQIKRMMIASISMAAGLAVVSLLLWAARKPTADPVPASSAARVPGTPNPDAADLLETYQEAMATFVNGEFSLATEQFDQMFRHPEALEPTKTWAGIQAVISAMLSQDETRARVLGEILGKHLETSPVPDDEVNATFIPIFARLASGNPPTTTHIPNHANGAPTLLGILVSAIHEWQHGDIHAAAKQFRSILAMPVENEESWVGHHRNIAQLHLDDFQISQNPSLTAHPETEDAADEILETLHQLHHQVRMPGPIIERIRRARMRVERHRDTLESIPDTAEKKSPSGKQGDPDTGTVADLDSDQGAIQAKPPEPPAQAAPKPSVFLANHHINQYEFDKARDVIRMLDDRDMPPLARNAWMTVVNHAKAFIHALQDDVRNEVIPIPNLRTRDDRHWDQLRPTPDGIILGNHGEPIPWSSIHADSLNDWHRARVRDLPEHKRMQAHEEAVAFDLLAGDPERARNAIRILSDRDDHFKRYWDLILQNYRQ